MKWLVIVNPFAAGGSAGKNWNTVQELLVKSGMSFDTKYTSDPATTRRIVAEAISSSYRGIAVYGGDGTLSDAASVLVGNLRVVLAVIPAGSGNDWARSIGFSTPTAGSAVSAMASENRKTVDTAVARWEGVERFFLNSSGIGFDALVLNRAIALRNRLPLNKTSYAASLLFSALFPPVWQGEFSCDGRVFHEGGYLTFTAGVGSYSGGGMRLSPTALPDDKKLDGLCLTPMSFFSIVFNMKRVFDGELNETKWARTCRGDVITVKPTVGSGLILELDGEPVDVKGASYLELISVPESLRVAVLRT